MSVVNIRQNRIRKFKAIQYLLCISEMVFNIVDILNYFVIRWENMFQLTNILSILFYFSIIVNA